MKLPVQDPVLGLEFAIESIAQAGQLVKKVRQGMVEAAFTKTDASPVTIADFAAQALVASLLKKKFPSDVLVGEESAAELRLPEGKAALEKIASYLVPFTGFVSPEGICDWIDHGSQEPKARFWTMDPIDGTKGFIRGDQYAVALALIENGKVELAVMACPNLTASHISEIGGPGSLVCAVRGRGAWWTAMDQPFEWKPLKVSSRQGKELILLRSFERKHVDSPRMQKFIELLEIQKPPILMDSLAKYAVLAAGGADLLLRFPTEDHPHEWIWDQASGVLLIEEAGGRVTDLDGCTLDFSVGRKLSSNRGVVLSNGVQHARVLEVLKQIS
jgi:HAL2 family 3'(2'),5'-bisphosphate nucleotidase